MLNLSQEKKFEYGKLAGTKKIFPREKIIAMRLEMEELFSHYTDDEILSWDESAIFINNFQRIVF